VGRETARSDPPADDLIFIQPHQAPNGCLKKAEIWGKFHYSWFQEFTVSVKQAFDRHAKDYDSERKLLIPSFDDFYGAALALIPFQPGKRFCVLDLGAGTGRFTYLVAQRYPNAEFTLYDISDKMLAEARKRFSGSRIKVNYVVRDYSREAIKGRFDLVISALSIHHVPHAAKEDLFRRVFACIADKGMFINADQVMGDSPFIDDLYRSTWLKQIRANGVTDAMLAAALERMKEDKMSTLPDQLQWLREARFSEVTCWYQNFSLVVYSGRKE
jgi:tRNA (cmo5U34)-methyltransferase